MTTDDVLQYFRHSASAVAAALGLKPSAVYAWGIYPPLSQQQKLEQITGGALKAEQPTFKRGLVSRQLNQPRGKYRQRA